MEFQISDRSQIIDSQGGIPKVFFGKDSVDTFNEEMKIIGGVIGNGGWKSAKPSPKLPPAPIPYPNFSFPSGPPPPKPPRRNVPQRSRMPVRQRPQVPNRRGNQFLPANRSQAPQNLPPPPPPFRPRPRKVAFTGVVNIVTKKAYLCPLNIARGNDKYMGALSQGERGRKRNVSPIDHYQIDAIGRFGGKGFGEQFLKDYKSGIKTPRKGFMNKVSIGLHRIKGIRPSNSTAGAFVLESNADYSGSSGHKVLVRRLHGDCALFIGFSVTKNGNGRGLHSVNFVSRLNFPHFGHRGMNRTTAKAILDGLKRDMR